MAILGTVIAATTAIGTIVNGNLGVNQLDAVIVNIDSGTAYVGGVNVGTLATGVPLNPGAAVSLSLFNRDVVYAIAPTGTVQLSVLLKGVPPQ